MLAKVEAPFIPSILAQEAVHRILSTGNAEFCGSETAQMLHYLDALTPRNPIIPSGEARPGLRQRLSRRFQASFFRGGFFWT
ncbi:hypothetical protein NKI77_07920 [Mesorhizobium opportunistum]|uniref:Uncharacterized protein n=1 Tax=Mesorhizobium opportunistum TaxID=593909 RepID=A0ABV1YBI7_9HYPH|nr:hypothetical protein [Mesorhizobium sp.]TIN90734.1 MAG: hypothetical protein E5Y06_31350 [Mesorhizobium sp.]TJU97914.1 MAG: hypothetical protein E5Y08_16075 [Mesorhizobium sp.]TJV16281.1 MAG: hypothetical protein E5Y07_17880 [Mesorhizobium sp.]